MEVNLSHQHMYGTYLNSIGDGQARIGRGDLPVHEDNHECRDADQSHADDVQTHRQPAHGTAEQVEWSLVLVQQLLVPGRTNEHWLSCLEPCET